jgi:hypothetical protein
MAEFYAYENWRAHGHTVVVHAADCAFCNGGKGLGGGTRADNGKWHSLGEFSTAQLALESASRTIRGATVRLCSASKCKPPNR